MNSSAWDISMKHQSSLLQAPMHGSTRCLRMLRQFRAKQKTSCDQARSLQEIRFPECQDIVQRATSCRSNDMTTILRSKTDSGLHREIRTLLQTFEKRIFPARLETNM